MVLHKCGYETYSVCYGGACNRECRVGFVSVPIYYGASCWMRLCFTHMFRTTAVNHTQCVYAAWKLAV